MEHSWCIPIGRCTPLSLRLYTYRPVGQMTYIFVQRFLVGLSTCCITFFCSNQFHMHAMNACNSNINFYLTITSLLTVACINSRSLHVKLVGAEEHNTTNGIHVYDGMYVLS